jgi:hypothetical protein
MLKTNKVLFFDSEEFEEIILHYLDMGKAALAKKSAKLALDQHPKSGFKTRSGADELVYGETTNELYAIEPTNEEILFKKLISILKETNTIRRLNY